MNILITGQNGNIGTYLCSYLSEKNNVLGLDKEDVDITDREGVIQVIISLKPDVVIHTAALTNIDYCEKNESEAYKVNTVGSLNVAYVCNALNIPIVYLSCNYVYGDSKQSPYYETDECTPVNVYGKTKLAGEKMIRTLCKKFFILRTSWVFGGDRCYVRKIVANKNTPIFMCSSEVLNATYIGDLADCISRMIKTNYYGVYNCVNPGPISKANMVKKVFSQLKVEKNIVEMPESYLSDMAPRPGYSALNTYLVKNCFNLELPQSDSRLEEYIKKL
jgi:dTDP-4-dehydrorhamnose reductase